jgi:stage II sporulation protein AA (anti-sigma F factor antagonist)
MLIKSELQDDVMVISIFGELDLKISDKLRCELDKIINTSNVNTFILNFEEVSFIDSSGLGVLLGRYKKLKTQGSKLHIINVQPQVKRILTLSGITRLIDVTEIKNEC